MLRIVIAMASDDFGHMLEQQLSAEHSVVRCFDGNTALDLLQHLRPDVMLMDLFLPMQDGLSVLEKAQGCIPSLLIGLTGVNNTEVCRRAEELGITKLYLMPVNTEVFMDQLRRYLAQIEPGVSQQHNLQRRAIQLLSKLSFKTNLSGYQQILLGIPLVMQDISIPMCKELYPQIANAIGMRSSRPIEHTIRTAIQDAWENGDKELWNHYFPIPNNRDKPYPSNKQFFTTIVKILTME